ncbi:hypothetical protein AA0242T_2299 [Acetobacter aceti NRIC 0242]|uniref:Uncharacterized protein n=1 Tax=Acetobacter aceti NBRC 14818 TaxID=887700 RepID=A0AB33IHD6_ACEAC|nr:hypothetical protein [Acetobacter aceti]TCS33056.1 hypothetical protein EDC15_109128 [Acetobacter aceti NBRC 14818]BCK76490.1 hypothetical protein EMQ_2096 [Acetobacter aceti NBRC 14818]GBO81597.1 hypothetical protein AA0242T_2299 [Acetobacter aceti NRIC 0242]
MSVSNLSLKLPVPYLQSGKDAPEGVVDDAVIDWSLVLRLWVQPMVVDQNEQPVYAPCAVFLDDTWVRVGPVGSLGCVRIVCQRMAAIHDKGVSDETLPAIPGALNPNDMIVDVSPSELGDCLPGDPWWWDERHKTFKLNLAALGFDLALGLLERDLTEAGKIELLDVTLEYIETLFRTCDTIQPHLVRGYLEKTRKAALVWIRETSFPADEMETPEDDGRMLVDEIRRDGVTAREALILLQKQIEALYQDPCWPYGRLVKGQEDRALRAYNAGADRIIYFTQKELSK